MKLEDIKNGVSLEGVEPGLIVTVAAVIPVGEGVVQVIYKRPDGTFSERLMGQQDAETVAVPVDEHPWVFDGDGEAFKLTAEARRIDLAYLFDPMMAVHTSNVEPLPHQITAVYESMLPRQPLRFVLADDPGAGKTIMAGLYIRELIMRADAQRILIVAPGGLVDQWQVELLEKFGLEFRIYARALDASSPSGNPFEDHDHLIVRLDQVSRSDEYQEKVCMAGWDLVIFDEAHKLSAHYYGRDKIKRTRRFELAEALGQCCRHLLLMTATPHNGKEADFQLFLSLLDSDRFYGKFRDGVHKVDATDLMRRMVKEELVKFDGTPLFPERLAYTVNYELSEPEASLYEQVTSYVKTEMGKADQLAGGQRGAVGFALTSLQRRLASSPLAIYQSLRRRRGRLEERLRDTRLGGGVALAAPTLGEIPEDDDDLNAEEQETLEETLVDQASASRTVGELEAEIHILRGLEQQAHALVDSNQDRKWDELSRILQDAPHMRDAEGRQRKIIIFTEHRDTLSYLHAKIAGVLGKPEVIVTIHGGTPREARLEVQERFRSDPEVRVLLATDAAGEGVNLQVANLMVNYDLPWNPNRLEQRFGRIHRIGQTEVCHLWNLVARETREGDVYFRLLEKLRVESAALKGRVFDILGEVFEGVSLRDLLMDAIRYGDLPETRAKLYQRVDRALDHTHLKTILERNALVQESMSPERLFAVKEEMEKAEARRLQPFFVRSYFLQAFKDVGGSIHPREEGRYEINHVPAAVMGRDRMISGRSRRDNAPVLRRYERVCFTKEAVRPQGRPGLPPAVLLHPGHPLMMAVTDLILERHSNLLRQGAILVDPTDEGDEAGLLFLLTHEIKSGDGTVLSKRLQFVRVSPAGEARFAGWAPHLDLEPLGPEDRGLLYALLGEPWIHTDQEQRALSLAAASLVPQHYQEVAGRRIAHVDKTLAAVNERLTKEIVFWSDRWLKLKEDKDAGKDVRLNLENARRTVLDLEGRLEARKKELQAMRHVSSATPVALGGALVVPAGLLARLRAAAGRSEKPTILVVDAAVKRRTELMAMKAVQRVEEARGCRVVDVAVQKCGWDLTSYPPPAEDGRAVEARHIEVKGRLMGGETITVTRNEILYALNQADKFILAVVLVHPTEDVVDGPYYLKRPFESEPNWGVTSWNIEIKALLERAEKMS
jgi:superfamily II DNA or RNA helicase